ncbi:MAG TPA: rhodanese-like domain-containing protein [Ignavibacteriaceae bacterium]|nr:rhodanese-like domain-containing protein [Ignavibacteriaceae bacterium]
MRKYIIVFSISLIIAAANFYGCLKDKITPPVENPLKESGELLFYLEDNGDYINSSAMPSLVDVDEVHSNIQYYLLLDIRKPDEFSAGHIQNAINKIPSELIAYLDSINYQQIPKIIIISKNGQSSAYYTCLLRLYGFNNTFSMSYGMAAWNQAFSDEWLAALNFDYTLLSDYSDVNVPKPPFTPLPEISLSGTSLEDRVKNRIKNLMMINFEDYLIESEGTATINYGWLMAFSDEYLIVCYDTTFLYKDIMDGIFHPAEAISLHPAPNSELSSTEYLQSIPSNKKSAFYSTNGQLTAFVTAYLRLLGYDARSVLFGANNMYYDLLLQSDAFGDEAFSNDKIRDYPFVNEK